MKGAVINVRYLLNKTYQNKGSFRLGVTKVTKTTSFSFENLRFGFIFELAQVFDNTRAATWLAGNTGVSAVQD